MMAGGITPLMTNATNICQKLNLTSQKTDITKTIPSRKIKKTEAQKINNLVVNFMMNVYL